MFVQAAKCKRGDATYLTCLVRESFRTEKGPRSRTICNITALPERTRDLIAQSLRGQTFVGPDEVSLTDTWGFGGLAVLRNHARLCFLAYWLSARLELQWRQKGQTIEVHNLLRQLQSIRMGRLDLGEKTFKIMMTQVPKDLNETLAKLDLLTLFAKPPAWTQGQL